MILNKLNYNYLKQHYKTLWVTPKLRILPLFPTGANFRTIHFTHDLGRGNLTIDYIIKVYNRHYKDFPSLHRTLRAPEDFKRRLLAIDFTEGDILGVPRAPQSTEIDDYWYVHKIDDSVTFIAMANFASYGNKRLGAYLRYILPPEAIDLFKILNISTIDDLNRVYNFLNVRAILVHEDLLTTGNNSGKFVPVILGRDGNEILQIDNHHIYSHHIYFRGVV